MTTLIEFIDPVRILRDLDRVYWPVAPGVGHLRSSELPEADAGLLANALGAMVCAVPAAAPTDEEWDFALVVENATVAARVGLVMGLPWRAEPPCVRLPEAVVNVEVSYERGQAEIECRFGFLLGWWVPMDQGERRWRYLTPEDDMLDAGEWRWPPLQ